MNARAAAAALPPPAAGCGVTVVIPARNEAATIAGALEALCAGRDVDGATLPPGSFDIIVYANNCTDATGAIARAVAARTPHARIFTVEGVSPPGAAHVGTARRYAMDIAAERFGAAGRPGGIIASIDADTLAAPDWIGAIVAEMRGRDAVGGDVALADTAIERLLAPVRLLYARERTYRRVLAAVEALVDPLPHDAAPRHGSFVGASFAVTTSCYVAVGGLPPLPRLEDLAFARALARIDARVRHSLLVRATTSPRLNARVAGGFGAFLSELHDCARRGTPALVEHPLRTLEDLEVRAALRRIRQGAGRPGDVDGVTRIFSLAPRDWLPAVESYEPLGTVYERIARRAEPLRRRYAPAPTEVAIQTLRAAANAAKARRLVAATKTEIAVGEIG